MILAEEPGLGLVSEEEAPDGMLTGSRGSAKIEKPLSAARVDSTRFVFRPVHLSLSVAQHRTACLEVCSGFALYVVARASRMVISPLTWKLYTSDRFDRAFQALVT